MAATHHRVAVDCYVRPSLFVEPVNDTIDRLREYAEGTVVDELAVESWPDDISLSADSDHEAIVEQYDQFRQWAELHDASLEPGFTKRERTTLVSDTPDRILTPPVLCLAIHVDDELISVAPHYTETSTYTVSDALTDIERLASEQPVPTS